MGANTGQNDDFDSTINAILGHDPFEDQQSAGDEPQSGDDHTQQDDGSGQQAEPQQDPEQQTDDQTGQAADSQQTQDSQSQSQSQEDPEKEELRQTVSSLQQTVAQLQQQMTQGQSQQSQDQSQGSEEQDISQLVPSYQFNVPDEVVQAMDSDDPAEKKKALASVLQGVAQNVHYNTLEQMHNMYNNLRQEMPKVAEQTATQQTETQRIREDYFGNYPNHDDPNIHPIVGQIASQVMKEKGVQQWDQSVRDETGRRVSQLLQSVAGQPAQPAQQGDSQQNQGNGSSAPPPQYGGNARPGNDNQPSNEVISTLMS